MKIITLVEDTLNEEQKKLGLDTEHGLSFYIETERHKLLFDVGRSDLYRKNAGKLGVDVTKAELLVLSHGHYDHGGGLADFLEVTEGTPVYMRKEAFGDYFSNRKTGLKYIGLEKELVDKYKSRLVYTENFVRIDDELSIFASIEFDSRFAVSEGCHVATEDQCGSKVADKIYADNLPSANVVLKKLSCDGEYVQDDFLHEQNLVIECEGKKILMSACSHCGIVNIIEEFIKIYGRRPDVVVGGLHLTNPQTLECESEDKLRKLADYFIQGDTKYYIGHCTGKEAFKYLKSVMHDRIEKLMMGNIIEV